MPQEIQLFAGRQIRTYWDDNEEKYYFCIIDAVEALTDIIYQTWAGLTAREYKRLKGLHKENLRDNMTNEELVMNMLAELTTTNITKEEHPITMDKHAQAASRGGSVARVAREAAVYAELVEANSKPASKLYPTSA